MKPFDKSGRPIFPKPYAQMQHYAQILLKNGYAESKNKPNLFYKQIDQGRLYADMRGTEEVPIYQDQRPLFYAQLSCQPWLQRRIWKNELEFFWELGCEMRLSFLFAENPPFDKVSTEYDEENGQFNWPVGKCPHCGKDFQDEGEYCSPQCQEKDRIEGLEDCKVCHQKIEREEQIWHHISYFPEEFVCVHKGCHNKIHKTNLYPELKPDQADTIKFYQNKPLLLK